MFDVECSMFIRSAAAFPWRLGVLASWRLGVLASWRLGVLASWRLGVLASWRLGVLASWRSSPSRAQQEGREPMGSRPIIASDTDLRPLQPGGQKEIKCRGL